jgi:hypothetical protein
MGARGLSYAEIAQQLQVSRASIGSDVQYLREQAKGTINYLMLPFVAFRINSAISPGCDTSDA